MFRNLLSLRVKLMLIFLFLAALVAAVGYYEVRSVGHVQELFANLTDQDFPRRHLLNEMIVTANRMESRVLYFAQAPNKPTPAEIAAEKSSLASFDKELQSDAKDYQRLLQQDTAERAVAPGVLRLQPNITTFVQAASSFVDAVPGTSAQLATQRAQLGQASNQLNATIDALNSFEAPLIVAQSADAGVTTELLTRTILLLMAGMIAAALILGALVAAMLSRSLNKLRSSALRIANGDFTQRVPTTSDDEFGQLAKAFNEMSDRLRESYQRLAVETERDKTLLEGMGEGMIAVDQKSSIVLINPVAADMLGLGDRTKFINKSIAHVMTLYSQDNRLIAKSQLPSAVTLEKGESVNDVFSFHTKDNHKILVNVSSNPVVLDGKVTGAIVLMRDVTKEKEVDRMKTEFISLASHQLRTPLSAIKWFTEMLLSGDVGKLKKDQADFAQNIAASTERMIQLVNSLLNISRIESGRIMVEPVPTDLHELISGIVNDLKAKTLDRHQNLIVSVHDDLPKIKLDPRLIGQVYLNLLTNAIKYTPKGGEISVFISKKGNDVLSQVTDNGYGIPKEQQGRIFQKFFRAENVIKVETDGTGLGLYLIKAVVESSGGKIWFESEEGKGTTFWFTIPLSGMKPREGEVTLDS